MHSLSTQLKFLLQLAKVQALLSRKLDGGLGGLGFTEFIILYQLSCSPDEKLRRIDLANKVGLTASGVTRLLLPMEKIGLVSKETNIHDARVSYVVLAPGGKRKLEEGLERAEYLATEILPSGKKDTIASFLALLSEISGTLL